MSEKIDEFQVCQPLNAARRKMLEKIIDDNAFQSPSPVFYEWEDPHLLVVDTKPVEWRIVFHARKVEIFAKAPFWARMLLTQKKSAQMHKILEEAFEQMGFFETSRAQTTKAPPKPAKKTQARKK